MNEWEDVTIEDLKAQSPNSLATGPFGSNISSRFFQDFGVPVIRGTNLSDNVSERLIDENIIFVSEEKASEFEKSSVSTGDLIFTCWGTIGQVGLIDNRSLYSKYIISNKQMKLTPDPSKADSLFLYYLFSGPEMSGKIKNQAIGSSVPGFNLGQLRSLILRLPPLNEQRIIARILGSLDDKIELNRRMNRTLEGMVRAIFKSWFVDFDPVHAKEEGRAPIGMDAETATLFPDGFEDSERGKIPRGWKTRTLSDLCSTQYGFTTSAKEGPTGPKFLRVKDINKLDWIEWDTVPFCDISERDKQKYALKVGDIVVARMADPGKSAIIEQTLDAVFASYLVRLKTESLAHAYFVYGFLKSRLYAEYTEGARGGSVQANMNAKVIVGVDLVVPPVNVMIAFLQHALPLRQRITANVKESFTLTTLRDAILPMLISGDIRVKNFEKNVLKTY